jgi:hypothetical protein
MKHNKEKPAGRAAPAAGAGPRPPHPAKAEQAAHTSHVMFVHPFSLNVTLLVPRDCTQYSSYTYRYREMRDEL